MERPTFITRKPQSAKEHMEQSPSDKITSIAKKELVDFIKSFFSEKGKNRQLMHSMFPSLTPYVDDGGVENLDEDLSKKYTQIAALFDRTEKKLPCILVVGSQMTVKRSGLGISSGTATIDGKAYSLRNIIRGVSLNIVVGALDETTVSSLMSALSIIFQTTWEPRLSAEDMSYSLRLPLNPEVGTVEKIPTGTGDETNENINSGTITLEVTFEGIIRVPIKEFNHSLSPLRNETAQLIEVLGVPSVGSELEVLINSAKSCRLSTDSSSARIQPSNTENRFRVIMLKPEILLYVLSMDGNIIGSYLIKE